MIANTPSGQVAGRVVDTPDGPVSAFLGMPYAQASGIASRFRRAERVPGHRDMLDATSPAPPVPQNPEPFRGGRAPSAWSEVGSLSANVWAPRGASGAPVMVWVHGGGYVNGTISSSTTEGARLAAAGGVVVVALSYRLGALGFFPAAAALGEGFEDAANLGILDLVTGLEWVRDNIAAFGGNPGAITIFGQSAGAAAVGTILGMPAAQGLFQRAIMQSGTAERVRTPDQASEASERFLHANGLTATAARDLLTWPAERVLEAQQAFTDVIARETIGMPLPFQPVIDDRNIPSLPVDAVRSGASADVDLIVGTNLNEGSFFTAMAGPSMRTDEELDRALEGLARVHVPAGSPSELAAQYRAELGQELGASPRPEQAVESFLTDVQYRQPSNRLLDARAQAAGKTFAYLFSWASPTVPALGSCHTLELPFVFRQLDNPENHGLIGGDAPVWLSESMSGAWTSFAASGIPGLPETAWPEYDSAGRRTMAWNSDASVVTDPRGGLRRWWADAKRDARQAGRPRERTSHKAELPRPRGGRGSSGHCLNTVCARRDSNPQPSDP